MINVINKIAQKISGYNREKKYLIFEKYLCPNKSTKILDVGYADTEYSLYDNYLEKKYPYQQNITALGIESPVNIKLRYPLINAVQYNGGKFPFSENQFDMVWSNAVIEHVGSRNKQIEFIKEISRTSKKFFITTPNKNFPVEVHTRIPLLHYLPKSMFDKILMLIGKKWATGDYMYLLSQHDIISIMREAKITEYIILKRRILFFTIDYIIIKY